jgi:peptidoglycan/LPS O-acetylase OafA/YrhL
MTTNLLERAIGVPRLGREVTQQGRQQFLDGLRGVAALIVFGAHVGLVIFPAIFNGLPSMSRLGWEWALAATPFDILWAADFAVCIFFVMSALVLCAFYEREGKNFIACCVRRYIRLTLPIFAASALAYLLWVSIGMHNLEAQQITQEGWLKSFYLSRPHFMVLITEPFYQIYATPLSVLDPSLWTMKFELWGSVSVFLLCALVPNRQLRLVVLAIAAILTFRTYYLCFVGGAFLYEWSRLPQTARDGAPALLRWGLLLIGFYMGAFPFNGEPGNFWFGWMGFFGPNEWHQFGATPFVFGIMSIPALRALLTTRVPQYLGKISFSLYLIHVPLIGGLMTWLIIHLYSPPHRFRAMYGAVAITIPVVIACAHLFDKLVDGPAIRLSRKADKLINAKFPAQGARIQERPASAKPTPDVEAALAPVSVA